MESKMEFFLFIYFSKKKTPSLVKERSEVKPD